MSEKEEKVEEKTEENGNNEAYVIIKDEFFTLSDKDKRVVVCDMLVFCARLLQDLDRPEEEQQTEEKEN